MEQERVKPRPGVRCPRCGAHHWSMDSQVCEACWVDLGQMALWEDADEPSDTDWADFLQGKEPF